MEEQKIDHGLDEEGRRSQIHGLPFRIALPKSIICLLRKECSVCVEGTCLRQVLSDRIRFSNKSGYPGVYFKHGKWTARIQYRGGIHSLASFTKREDSNSARKQVEEWIKENKEQLMTTISGAAPYE